ncbi:MAG TPA: aspartyl-phosphate phosphatase Spo0E family protein [Clostridia bacterium]
MERCRERLHKSISKSGYLINDVVLEKSQELDKLIVSSMKEEKKSLFSLLKDCIECINKGSELCKACEKLHLKQPSNFEAK